MVAEFQERSYNVQALLTLRTFQYTTSTTYSGLTYCSSLLQLSCPRTAPFTQQPCQRNSPAACCYAGLSCAQKYPLRSAVSKKLQYIYMQFQLSSRSLFGCILDISLPPPLPLLDGVKKKPMGILSKSHHLMMSLLSSPLKKHYSIISF